VEGGGDCVWRRPQWGFPEISHITEPNPWEHAPSDMCYGAGAIHSIYSRT